MKNENRFGPHGPASDEQLQRAFTALSYFVVAFVVATAAVGGRVSLAENSNTNQAALAGSQTVIALDKQLSGTQIQPTTPHTAFDAIELSAKAAVVYDTTTGTELFAYRADVRLPLASLTKLMTALVAIEHFGPDATTTISQAALKPEGDEGLLVGDSLRIAPLASLTLVASSNDGAEALAEVENRDNFINRMNERARDMGLADTYFFNPSGLDLNERVSGGYGSASDVALLMYTTMRNIPDTLAHTTQPSFTAPSAISAPYRVKNTNVRVREVPGLIASKTGFTDLAGGNLAIMFDAGLAHPIIIVVLGSTQEGRFNDAYALATAAREELAKRN